MDSENRKRTYYTREFK